MTWAYAQQVEPTGAKFVLVTLANHASAEGYCYPSQDKLADETGQDERTVRRNIAVLERLGFIRRERRSNKLGHRAADAYWLVGFPSLADTTPASQPDSMPARDAEPTGHFDRRLPDILSEPTGQNVRCIKGTEPSVEPPVEPSIAAKPQKPRDPLWDTLVEIHQFTPVSQTPEHGRWNKAVGIYRKLGYGPAEIRRANDLYHRSYPGMPDGALAVAGRAQELISKTSRAPTSVNGHRPSQPFPDYDDQRKASA